MAPTSWPQRRRHRRLTLRVPVWLRCEPDGPSLATHATTLGAGGLFVATDRPFAPGTQLRVRLRLPGDTGAHELRAEVVWVDAGTAAAGRGMGLAFRDPEAMARLAGALARLATDAEPRG